MTSRRRKLTGLMLDARRLAEDNRDGRLALVTHVRMRGVPKRAPRERKP